MRNKETKYVTAKEAVQHIKSGDKIVLANFCAEPRYIPDALMNRAYELEGCQMYHLTPFGPFQEKYELPEMEKHVRCATSFAGRQKTIRKLLEVGRADFYPVGFSGIPRLLREGDFQCDVFMLSVSPPDKNGYCSLGVSVDYAWGAIERPARLVIAEINPNMPYTYGRSIIHISDIDYAVNVDYNIFTFKQFEITEMEKSIGENVASLVEDGSTIQIGIGAISEATINFLHEKKDLGMHTEMIPEGLRPLVENGVINGSKKSIHKGQIVATFLAGTQKLYEWIDHNPMIHMMPVDYTNDPRVIAQNSKMVAINAALQVDLFGNVYADMLGLNDQYTGAGGALDFVIGCALSPDAKFITTIPSMSRDGKYSRIISHPSRVDNNLTPQIPMVCRYLADHIVTEYGIAKLLGRSNSERAKALIAVAHPDQRGQLEIEARKLGLFY